MARTFQDEESGQSAQAEASYYGLPALKPSMYGWTVALYIFSGGLAGGAQLTASAVDLAGVPDGALVIFTGRVVALLGALVGGVLLIIDLHTRRRFYNMLRIFRPTSPMSIGTYVLMAFGFFSLLAVAGDVSGYDRYASISGTVAAVFGLAMATYTAPLLSATSTPLWAAVPRLMACRFAASSMATGAAVLVLAALAAHQMRLAGALAMVATLAVVVDLAAALVSERRYHALGLATVLRQRPWGPVHLVGVLLLGNILPLGLYFYDLVQPPGAGIHSAAASLLVLAGGALMRGVVLLAGNASARRPADYFRFARAGTRERPADHT